MRQFCEAVYCGIAPADALRPSTDGRIAFPVRLTDAGRTAMHAVAFEEVRDYRRSTGGQREPASGDVTELSMVEVERESSAWRVWFKPWYLDEVEFRCQRITFDGREVTGGGRWLQDELPDRSAG